MEYTIRPPDGDELELDDDHIEFLTEVVKEPFTYWDQGSGDSGVFLHDDEGKYMMFFKTPEGMFIQAFPSQTAPLIDYSYKPINEITHYVGGEPFAVPDICLCDDETAIKILKYFVKTGKLHPDYVWVDIYDYIKPPYD